MDTPAKTNVRHGKLSEFVAWFQTHGLDPQVSEGSRTDLENLAPGDRAYGALSKGCKVLLIEAPGVNRDVPTRFYHIVL